MVSLERREGDDVFFDSSDVLSIDEQVEEEFQVWFDEPVSVEERRERFFKKMGLLEEEEEEEERFESMCSSERISDFEATSTSSESSSVCGSESELECCVREENYGSSNSMSDEEDSEQGSTNASSSSPSPSKIAKRWSFNFKCFAGEKDRDFESSKSMTMSKVKVKTNKKNHVELSAAYNVQEINGHKGRIWSLKFSPDGKFLATGGEDGVVKIWRITLSDSLFTSLIQQEAPRTQQEEEQPLVLFPQKSFHIEEKPFQELYGHTGDVLDLAWSDSNLLLSASKDKTVRLWKIGCDQCLHIFHHNNYVTCVEFNPVNKNNFISGSIDGKARIWGLSEQRVIAWTDAHDSISAICYKPNGNGFVVGCINGNCRFYQVSGNDVMMEEEQILLRRRHRITGVEFCPNNSDKLMVSSDDSKLRIFERSQILHKFKATSKSVKQSSASFVSSTGKHILSIRRGLGVYLWSKSDDFPGKKSAKSSRAFEYIGSPGVCAAAAWSPSLNGEDESRRVVRQLQSSGRLSRSSRVTATWPEEKLTSEGGIYDVGECGFTGAWSLVIVTASVDGVIRTFHNYGLPRRL